jgi:small-conductance mechanosensitive channel
VLGEYIDVGDAKGTVEKIGLRSMQLRHHRGSLNVVPYGAIRRLNNQSRDWVVEKIEFRLTYDTDIAKVKKIIKRIGRELAEDPEMGRHILEPLKSQGVLAMEDSALLVKAVDSGQLRSPAAIPDRERAVRSRAWRLHGRNRDASRPIRARGREHPLSR